jgi:hypothetical protein
MQESNVFTDARMNAIKAGKKSFKVGNKEYKITGDTSDELNAGVTEATGNVKLDDMLKNITNKKAVTKQQKADTQQQAHSAFGNMFGGGNPVDKLSVKKVSEGRSVGIIPASVTAQLKKDAKRRERNVFHQISTKLRDNVAKINAAAAAAAALKKEEVELEEGKYASTIGAIAAAGYQPKIGDKIRTRKGGQIPGTVTSVTDTHVHFKHPEGKTYRTSVNNVMREEAVMEKADQKNSYQKAQEHMNKASKALETSDMQAHHQHLSNHYEEMGKWHESKGRGDMAQTAYDKAEGHHEQSLKPHHAKSLKK